MNSAFNIAIFGVGRCRLMQVIHHKFFNKIFAGSKRFASEPALKRARELSNLSAYFMRPRNARENLIDAKINFG